MTIDGVPLHTGWVTFVPADDPNLPPASFYHNDQFRPPAEHGRYRIGGRFGPVTGRYRVEVRHLAKAFLPVPTIDSEHVYTDLGPDAPGPIIVDLKPGNNVIDLAIRTK